jgi:hypothetical protein
MSYASYLKELLRPLGVYDLSDGTRNGGELESIGGALDQVEALLEDCQQEMNLTTARGEGLERIAALLPHRPVTSDPEQLGAALAALLRINGDSFTLAAINDSLSGCGINAVVSETGSGQTVEVRFPDVPGIPDGIDEMREIIEGIIPCHLLIRYVYWYITWARMEARFSTWDAVERTGLSWGELEKLVK